MQHLTQKIEYPPVEPSSKNWYQVHYVRKKKYFIHWRISVCMVKCTRIPICCALERYKHIFLWILFCAEWGNISAQSSYSLSSSWSTSIVLGFRYSVSSLFTCTCSLHLGSYHMRVSPKEIMFYLNKIYKTDWRLLIAFQHSPHHIRCRSTQLH